MDGLEPARAGDSRFSVKPFCECFNQESACDPSRFNLKAAVASFAGSKTIFANVEPHADAWGYTLPPVTQAL
jgi:hypothetical protein